MDILSDDVDVSLAANGSLVLHNLRMRNYLHNLALIVEHGYGFFGEFFSAHILEGV